MNSESKVYDALVEYDNLNRHLVLRWTDGHKSIFPYQWLRHQCSYPLTGRPEQSGDYTFLEPESPRELLISSCTVDAGYLLLQWRSKSEGTQHKLAELRKRCLSDDSRNKRKPQHKPWQAADAAQFDWKDVADLEDKQQRLEFFLHIRDFGIVLANGLTPNPGSVESLLKYFGPPRHTHFGYLFDIRSSQLDNKGTGQNIGATANNAQSPHSDEGWRHGPPGISLFHCLKCAEEGGASVFVDALGCAEKLRIVHPESFEFLSTVPLLFEAERNAQERFRSRGRVICTDTIGVVRGVRITDRTLAPLDLPLNQIEQGYKSLSDFYRLLTIPENRFEIVLKPGELVAFDNHQVLHARHSFDPRKGERWLQQLSIDREEFHNQLRQLGDQLGNAEVSNWEPDSGVLTYG
ncbi:MAG: gamma-butyrobetaine dioxygenase [Gammaproteobacteria bacterium]